MLKNEKQFQFFQERTRAQLRLALAEVKFWTQQLGLGKVPPHQAYRRIESMKRIIKYEASLPRDSAIPQLGQLSQLFHTA